VAEQLLMGALQAQLQAYLNCAALCQALHRQTKDPYVKEALGPLVEDLQASLATLAGHLRRLGYPPGSHEPDRQGMAVVRDALATRSLREQLLAVRCCLAELVARYEAQLASAQDGQTAPDWLVSLSQEAHRLLRAWDQHMYEMKAGPLPQ
jgi:hypothetical protein